MFFSFFYKKLPKDSQAIIQETCSFHNRLSKKNKQIFEHRVVRFIEHHEFVGREGIQVSTKMKLLVAGTAIKLSFGFNEYLYPLFSSILIYPKNYYSALTKKRHKGETNPQFGVVVFSWEDFKAGISVEDDNLNLGLHEFTHALHFSFEYGNSNEGQVFTENFESILTYLTKKSVQKNLIETGYIRSYAFENKYEFLAVLVEHFFETPQKFDKEHPIIYKLMVELLRVKSYK